MNPTKMLINKIDDSMDEIRLSKTLNAELRGKIINNLKKYKNVVENTTGENEIKKARVLFSSFCTESLGWNSQPYKSLLKLTKSI